MSFMWVWNTIFLVLEGLIVTAHSLPGRFAMPPLKKRSKSLIHGEVKHSRTGNDAIADNLEPILAAVGLGDWRFTALVCSSWRDAYETLYEEKARRTAMQNCLASISRCKYTASALFSSPQQRTGSLHAESYVFKSSTGWYGLDSYVLGKYGALEVILAYGDLNAEKMRDGLDARPGKSAQLIEWARSNNSLPKQNSEVLKRMIEVAVFAQKYIEAGWTFSDSKLDRFNDKKYWQLMCVLYDNQYITDKICDKAFTTYNVSAVSWCCDNGFEPSDWVVHCARRTEAMEMLKVLAENGFHGGLSKVAAEREDVHLMKWAVEQGDTSTAIAKYAESHDNIELMRWAFEHNLGADTTIACAARHGDYELVKQALARGYHRSSEATLMADAIRRSDFEFMRIVATHHKSWQTLIFTAADDAKRTDVIKWLVKQGCTDGFRFHSVRQWCDTETAGWLLQEGLGVRRSFERLYNVWSYQR